ncbi:MAG: AMP-binding protein [Deltaproteobacteria bacterium]|jgi:acetyl-CoA synthetase|nr:AMP-binding protein [Deltaproteobacteria bacterium]
MRKISKQACYYYYGKPWESWDHLRANFSWEIPEDMNAAFYVCDVYADDQDRVAIFHEDYTGEKGRITFSELKNATNQLANYFVQKGLNRGDRVAICLAQRPQTLISHLAVWKAGCISLPLTVLFGPDALRYRLQNADARIAIVEKAVLNTVRSLRDELAHLETVIVVGDTELEVNEVGFEDAVAQMPPEFEPVLMHPDDPMLLTYTGGTTGDPKGVVQRHCFVFHVAGHFGALGNAEIRSDDVFWNPADYAWIAPLFDLAFPALFYGRPVLTYLSGGKFDPEKAFKLIEDYKLTVAYIPPTGLRMMRRVENAGRRFDLSSLRVLVSGGESLGKAVPEWAVKTFNPETVVHEIYGQSEGTLLTMNCQRYFDYKYNIGKAVPGLELAVLDDSGHPVPAGKVGELAVKATDGNPIVLKQYWKKPRETEEKFLGGWMLTGDLVIKDEEDYFTFISRKDDVIISSGYRIGPVEVEDTIIKHEAVVEAGVIGVPDEMRGEIVKAFIALRPGYEPSEALKKELQDFVKQRLAKHEYPREIEFISEIPKTTTGKIRRKDLREGRFSS